MNKMFAAMAVLVLMAGFIRGGVTQVSANSTECMSGCQARWNIFWEECKRVNFDPDYADQRDTCESIRDHKISPKKWIAEMCEHECEE